MNATVLCFELCVLDSTADRLLFGSGSHERVHHRVVAFCRAVSVNVTAKLPKSPERL